MTACRSVTTPEAAELPHPRGLAVHEVGVTLQQPFRIVLVH